jgi:CRISPR-associated protein Csm3
MPSIQLTHENLTTRYRFIGTLVLETGLHIGSGRGSTLTDALVIRTAKGEPYIPGSSFKGALRSSVERIAPNLSNLTPPVTTCQLIENGATECLSVTRSLQEQLRQIQDDCETAQRTNQSYHNIAQEDRREYLLNNQICTRGELQSRAFARLLPYRFIEHKLCDTCKLFGSTSFAAKVRISDQRVCEPWVELMEIRDGVGIDRDTETARPKVKFDLEVVPAQTEFQFCFDAENLTVRDLGLLCIGIQEFRMGLVPLGGRSTRGLGACQLILSDVYDANLGDVNALTRYLTSSDITSRMTRHEPDGFIKERIRAMLKEGGLQC